MLPFFTPHISLKEKILFYESIANLLEGGITLLGALKGLA
jgi:type II secretory pathway component PulF